MTKHTIPDLPLPMKSVRWHQRKRGVIASSLGYWFVVGVVLILLAQTANSSASIVEMLISQHEAVIAFLCMAMFVSRVFAFQWARLDALEHGYPQPVLRGVLHAIMAFDPVRHADPSRGSSRFDMAKLLVVAGSVLSCHFGAYVAVMAVPA